MTRLLPVVVLAFALSACGGGKTSVKAASGPEYEAVKARSDKAHGEPEIKSGGVVLEVQKGTNMAQPVRNEVQERRGKTLGVDPDGCTWVEGSAKVSVGPQDTRHQARAAVMEQARAAAVQDFLGVDVKSKFMDFQQEGLRGSARLTEGILQTTRTGRILKETVLEEGYRDIPDCPGCLYHMRLKACVLPRESGADKDFSVTLRVSSQRYLSGDPAKFFVTATRDCWVYVYNVYDLGALPLTTLVYPNSQFVEKELKAGVPWEYPSAVDNKNGISMSAELPNPTDDISAETIRVVCAKAKLPQQVYGPETGGYLGVLQRLTRANVEWAEDAEAYTIYKR